VAAVSVRLRNFDDACERAHERTFAHLCNRRRNHRHRHRHRHTHTHTHTDRDTDTDTDTGADTDTDTDTGAETDTRTHVRTWLAHRYAHGSVPMASTERVYVVGRRETYLRRLS
jgi:hypothetical protein